MRNLRKNKGITLIALVITVIVLLILAGVSLSLVMGNEGILGRATNAVDKNNKETAVEELELAVSEMNVKYYEDYNENSGKIIGAFIRENLNGYETADGTISCEGEKVIYVCGHDTVTGTIDDEGRLEIDKEGIVIIPGTVNLKIEEGSELPTATLTANLVKIEGEVSWKSSDESIATVSGSGKTATVTAVAKGNATITASCAGYTANCTVVIKTGIPAGLDIGSPVSYSPSGTYNWQAEYCSSVKIPKTDDMHLSSAAGESFAISDWKVLKIDREKEIIQLVPSTATSGKVYLGEAQGYNNGVKLLNDACSALYSNKEKEIIARSINVEDIEMAMDKDKLEAAKERFSYKSESYSSYLNEKNQMNSAYTTNKSYPIIYSKEDFSVITPKGEMESTEIAKGKGIGWSESVKENGETKWIERKEGNDSKGAITDAVSIQPYMTYYQMEQDVFADSLESTYTTILRPTEIDKSYWVASRNVVVFSDVCSFCMFYTVPHGLYGYDIYRSNEVERSYERAMFP